MAGGYPDRCIVYALTEKEKTPSKPLKIDFFEHPESSHKIMAALLNEVGKDNSNYIKMFLSVDMPSLASLRELPPGEEIRARRKILMFWSILHRAGFSAGQGKLSQIKIDPEINKSSRSSLINTHASISAWHEAKN